MKFIGLRSLLYCAILIGCCFASTQALRVTIVNDTNGKIGANLLMHMSGFCYTDMALGEERVLEIPDQGGDISVGIYYNHVYYRDDNYPDKDRIENSYVFHEVQDGDRITASEFIGRAGIVYTHTLYRGICDFMWQRRMDDYIR